MNIDDHSFVAIWEPKDLVNIGNHMCSLKIKNRAPYRLHRRAEQQAETRLDIIRAAVQLHSTIGPAHTTVSAIAKSAGVQRLTVYRHFPNEEAIFAACSAYAFAENPPPDAEAWRSIAEPEARFRFAVQEFYSYYRRNQQLLANIYRDAEILPVIATVRRREAMAKSAAVLTECWILTNASSGKLVAAAIGHALDFRTWQSLAVKQQLSDAEAVEMMAAMVSRL